MELCSGKGPGTIAKSLSVLVDHGVGPSFTQPSGTLLSVPLNPVLSWGSVST